MGDLTPLLRAGEVEVTTLLGHKLCVLTGRARTRLGLKRLPRSADALLDQLARRLANAEMLAEGYAFERYESRNVAVYRHPEHPPVWSAAKYAPYRVRSVRTLLKRYGWEVLKVKGRLDIWTPAPHTLASIADKHSFVCVRRLAKTTYDRD